MVHFLNSLRIYICDYDASNCLLFCDNILMVKWYLNNSHTLQNFIEKIPQFCKMIFWNSAILGTMILPNKTELHLPVQNATTTPLATCLQMRIRSMILELTSPLLLSDVINMISADIVHQIVFDVWSWLEMVAGSWCINLILLCDIACSSSLFLTNLPWFRD